MRTLASCRICDGPIEWLFELGEAPLANHLGRSARDRAPAYPLSVGRCPACTLLQLSVAADAGELFADYAYATPPSALLSAHYQSLGAALGELHHGPASLIVEIGSNNGEFLATLPSALRRVGVDPAANVAEIAAARGIDTRVRCFDQSAAEALRDEFGPADAIVARHCMAHIDDVHEVVAGVRHLLAPGGIFVIENAYALATVAGLQFDQIYHEHMSYLAVRSVEALCLHHGLRVFHALGAELHGGSIVVFACHDGAAYARRPEVDRAIEAESEGLSKRRIEGFAERARALAAELAREARYWAARGKLDVYGATAKSATLLHLAGLGPAEIRWAVDGSPLKQGRYLPCGGIEIVDKDRWHGAPPQVAIMTAWNYEKEIMHDEREYLKRGGKFLIPLPYVRALSWP